MDKRERKRYERELDDVCEALVMKAWHEAHDITEGVYLDILLRLRSKLDVKIGYIQEQNRIKQENKK